MPLADLDSDDCEARDEQSTVAPLQTQPVGQDWSWFCGSGCLAPLALPVAGSAVGWHRRTGGDDGEGY